MNVIVVDMQNLIIEENQISILEDMQEKEKQNIRNNSKLRHYANALVKNRLNGAKIKRDGTLI